MRTPITLGLHIPNFNFPGVDPEDEFRTITDIATTAEASGFSSVSLMDHLHQIGPVGPPENYMFEGSTMLAAIAARTTKLTFGLLVGSVTYRNPAIAAKITTTLDIISGGRVWHGIGAGWFEEEHRAYG
jgi:alkanesulfonate monooxygenase SsuD/methylene tetrahydromethanopterin reductase-like flavin-dependent oxidoreductase (luciferase family)